MENEIEKEKQKLRNESNGFIEGFMACGWFVVLFFKF